MRSRRTAILHGAPINTKPISSFFALPASIARVALVAFGCAAGVSHAAMKAEECAGIKSLIEANLNGFRGVIGKPLPGEENTYEITRSVAPLENCKLKVPASSKENEYPRMTCELLPQTKPDRVIKQNAIAREIGRRMATDFVKDISTCIGVAAEDPMDIPAKNKKHDIVSWYLTVQAANRSRETGLTPTGYIKVDLELVLDGETIAHTSDQTRLDFTMGRYDSAAPLASYPALPKVIQLKSYLSLVGISAETTAADIRRMFGIPTSILTTEDLLHWSYEDASVSRAYDMSITISEKSDKVKFVTINERRTVAWLQQRGIVDEKPHFIGRHVEDVYAALGKPTNVHAGFVKYKDDKNLLDLTFFCPSHEGFACKSITVYWRGP